VWRPSAIAFSTPIASNNVSALTAQCRLDARKDGRFPKSEGALVSRAGARLPFAHSRQLCLGISLDGGTGRLLSLENALPAALSLPSRARRTVPGIRGRSLQSDPPSLLDASGRARDGRGNVTALTAQWSGIHFVSQ
jgi:hypothetical protein